MRYSYQTIGPNGITNGTNFLSFVSMNLGKDFTTWNKHPEFQNTMQQAHEIVFRETGNCRGGLKMFTEFLRNSDISSDETKMKRKNMYNDVLFYAQKADLITIDELKERMV